MGYNTTDGYLRLVDQLVDTYSLTEPMKNSLMGYLKSVYRSDLQNNYSAPMLWIGMYIAAASLVCILAMAADLLHGLRNRRLWFPCTYFRINSAFLAVISVAMKLPVDLSGSMPGDVDQVAKLGSMAFMCTMMANLLPCLATMNNSELLSNITALCILVVTLAVNVCIQIGTGVVSYKEDAKMLQKVSPNYDIKISKYRNTMLASTYVGLSLLLLIIHVCTCLAILKSKKIIESKYQQGHDRASKDLDQPSSRELIMAPQKLENHVINHWIMAASGSPQFITACFRTTSASGVICVLVTVLHTLTMSWTINAIFTKDCDSDYGWSMIVIVIVQFIGVVIGTIAPLSRCFSTLNFKVSLEIISKHLKVFGVESYWTSKLYDWKRASIKLLARSHSLKVVTETLKKLIISFCIEFQEGVVVVCKIIALIPFVFMICLWSLKWLLKALFCSSEENNENSQRNKELHPYVLCLEDKMELADRTLEGLSKSVNRFIQKGEKRKPKDLMKLIEEKSTIRFQGVGSFDHSDHHLPTLLSKVQYQDCWSLAVVTLTTIAVSLRENEVESLLKSVREGLRYVTQVEESLNVTDDYASIRKEVETLWDEVDVHKEWLGHKFQDLPSHVKTAGQIVEWFRDKAKNIDHEDGSHAGRNDDSMHRSVCANSMYHITKTILLNDQENIGRVISQEELFNDLSSKIADIIAACFTNLPQVIMMKCDASEIEKREASVKHAAQLLGETREIIEKLRRCDIPSMNPSDLPYINKWRAYKEPPQIL